MSQAAAAGSPVTTAGEFVPDVFAIRSNGKAMPGRLVSIEGHLATVASPQGTEYTFPLDALLSVDEARQQLGQDRAQFVANGYRFEEIHAGRDVRAVRCWNPAHPVRSDHVLTIRGARVSCSCPAYLKSGGSDCKHRQGWLIREARQEEAPAPAPAPKPKEEAPAARTFTSDEW